MPRLGGANRLDYMIAKEPGMLVSTTTTKFSSLLAGVQAGQYDMVPGVSRDGATVKDSLRIT